MTDLSRFGLGAQLTFLGPLSTERADRLAAGLAASKPANVIDFGCGWGELLLRVLEAAPEAAGVGIDTALAERAGQGGGEGFYFSTG